VQYAATAPGAGKNDTTILSETLTTSTSGTTGAGTTGTSGTTSAPGTTTSSLDVAWTNVVNATVTGTTMQKTAGCGDCFDGGAISRQQVAAGTGVSFSVGGGQRLFVGLGHDTSASTSYLLDYAFSFWPGGTFEVRENNIYRTEGTYSAS